MYKKATQGWLKHLNFMLLDMFCLLVSLAGACILRNGWGYAYANPLYRNAAVVVALIHTIIGFFNDSYKDILKRGYWKEFLSVLKHNVLVVGGLIFYLFITQKGVAFSRTVLILFSILNMLFLYAARILLKRGIRSQKKKQTAKRCLLIVCYSDQADTITRHFSNGSDESFLIKGLVFIDREAVGETVNGTTVVANIGDALTYIKQNWIDEVFINVPVNDGALDEFYKGCSAMGTTLHIRIEGLLSNLPANRVVEDIAGYSVITTSIGLVTPGQMFIKRCMDIGGALIGLFLTGIVYIVFAPIIYCQSPGPIFYSQSRVGKNGKIFKIFKFRSMYLDADERKKELLAQNKMNGLMFKMDHDPRIFPVGRLMRATSLDEFPQFWNVLKGDMSLVGTRPPTLDEYEHYEYHHKGRLATKPGLTGMWQVSGRSNITDFEEIVALDKQYIENWNLGLDFKILLKTVLVVLKKEGSV